MALYDDAWPPARDQLYVADCDASDPYQKWSGDTLTTGDSDKDIGGSTLINEGEGKCLNSVGQDPMTVAECDSDVTAFFYFNATNSTISLTRPSSPDSAREGGACLDLNGGFGPDIDIYPCHETDNTDYLHQLFSYDASSKTIHPILNNEMNKDACLSVTNISPANRNGVDPWEGGNYKNRIADYMRLLKSSGMNAIALQDVNACGIGTQSLESDKIKTIAMNLYVASEPRERK